MPRHPGRVAVVIGLSTVLFTLLVSCAASKGPSPSGGQPRTTRPTSYVEGTVTAGPRCPVARAERPCPPREVPGALVQLLDGTRILADDLTDQHGRFRLQTPAGIFVVRATNVGAYRSTASHPVR